MSDTKIQALKNGPYLVTGDVDYVDGEGRPLQPAKQPVALCRCGHSANKPFCDGAHRKVNFQG